ncbi:hypothetical protein PL263_05860 [Methylomonas sp. EFPC3]|uniref:hypothetical protein n=1 Tax=Methylomonas sp. EFPC3 TaxID=3021710 RepID=UPI002417CC19|nr:hypothetical protein [Methylomonas sp. EFPC3]WFP51552.1 hypothetical protein PL263_05860 [Methylomonas sp. EFPC3]
MTSFNKRARILVSVGLILFFKVVNAQVIQGISGSVDIHPDDTAIGAIHVGRATINNQGLIKAEYSVLQGNVTLNNSGNVFFEGGITAGGLNINNSASGLIVFTDYIDGYQTTNIENVGTIVVANAVGNDSGSTSGSWTPFTYMYQGLIHNAGSFLIKRVNNPQSYGGGNVCEQASRILTFRNDGFFEVGSGSKCDFGLHTKTQYLKATYVQTAGETRVNGEFGAHILDFQGGVLTGSGKVVRFPEQLWNPGFTISPGNSKAPYNQLTLVPESGYFVFGEGSLDFEIGSTNSNSKIRILGEAYIVGSAVINVKLKNGFMPSVGNSFVIVTANYLGTDDFNQSNLRLPKLPANRQWRLDNDGTNLKLTVI